MSRNKSQSFKEQAVKIALNRGPDKSLRDIAEEQGIGYSTLQKWINKSRNGLSQKTGTQPSEEKRPIDWNQQERWDAVFACEGKDEKARSVYCRERGLYPHHLTQWKTEFMANTVSMDAKYRTENRLLKEENNRLKKDLARKEKALAEAAALITLRKKLAAQWAGDEDN